MSLEEHAALLPLLPEKYVGRVERIEPIRLGLSGVGVYAVTAARGEYVLRVQPPEVDAAAFARQLRVLERAVEAEVAPAVVHVDAAARAVLSVRVAALPLGMALADPSGRGAVLASVVEQLRRVHALDPSDAAPGNPVEFARAAFEKVHGRVGFPGWASAIPEVLAAVSVELAGDRRRVLSHNDVNPSNVLWDGARVWLVDWDVAALGHPHYDLATLALFLRLEHAVALHLVAGHDGAPPDAAASRRFRALRQLAGLLSGLTFLGLVDDLTADPAPTRAAAPSLGDCYAALRSGQLDLQAQRGRAWMGLALLSEALATEPG